MAYRDDTDSTLIITIGAVSGLLVIVVAIGLQAWFLSEQEAEVRRKSAGSVNNQLAELHNEQQRNMTTYRWIDREKQTAAIPIDEAMKLLVQNNGKLPK